jgi:polyribonucleotide 5'-hydroxyl-kinase
MVKNYDQKPTTSAAVTHSDERITVLKLSKSGGCVDRDEAFMKAASESQIRSYFFGTAATTASSTTTTGGVVASISGGGGSNSNKITLSPHTQQLDFGSLALYNYTITSSQPEEDEDEYDPSNFGAGAESFSSLTDQQDSTSTNTLYDPLSSTYSSSVPGGANDNEFLLPLKKFTQPPTLALANSLIAITHVPPNAQITDIRDSSIMGFVYVADVDADKKKVRVLAPVGGRMPARALVWGKNWPGEVVGLVG